MTKVPRSFKLVDEQPQTIPGISIHGNIYGLSSRQISDLTSNEGKSWEILCLSVEAGPTMRLGATLSKQDAKVLGDWLVGWANEEVEDAPNT